MNNDNYVPRTPDSDFLCNFPDVAYVPASTRENEEKDERIMILTPWTVQNICYEVIKNYMIVNPPQNVGYKFSQTYDPDELKTGISLNIAFHYSDLAVQQRPALYVSRGEASFGFPTINQTIGLNSRESEKTRYSLVQMPIAVNAVATNVGFAEQLAEYIFKIFLSYQEVIKNDFCLRQFKLVSLSQPSLYLESKDHFLVTVNLLSIFDMGAVVKGDDLKLKTVQHTIFTNCLEKPMATQ